MTGHFRYHALGLSRTPPGELKLNPALGGVDNLKHAA
jgi:hypothetical protein